MVTKTCGDELPCGYRGYRGYQGGRNRCGRDAPIGGGVLVVTILREALARAARDASQPPHQRDLLAQQFEEDDRLCVFCGAPAVAYWRGELATVATCRGCAVDALAR